MPSSPVATWHCVELLLDRSPGGTPMELRVNDETVVMLPDEQARERGEGILLGVGPQWIESAATAPELTIADLEFADTPLGCE